MKTLPSLVTKTVILNQGDPEEKRKEILAYFHKTFDTDEKLYETLLSPESFYLRADPLRHPLIFYIGHTAVFFINKLILAKIIHEHLNPTFESMFAIGVDEMSWDDLSTGYYDWPALHEVMAYRGKVREVVDNAIKNLPLELPIGWSSPFWVIMMGIEHERIHLETSSVLIRQLPIEKVAKNDFWKICQKWGEAPQNELLPVAGGKIQLGKIRDSGLYGWDNEYGQSTEIIEPFNASKYLVSNREFLDFAEDKGYEKEEFWTEEGWSWRNFQKSNHPRFWILKEDGSWNFRTMVEIIEMPWNWPVEVNYLEAKAFCNWKSKQTGKTLRLPTEAEWHHFRDLHQIPDQPFWEKAPGNINLEHFASSVPVDMFGFGKFYDIIGNVWQWTETPITGFPGFEIHPFYDDFSTPTFDGRHNLIKGGSWISTGNEATRDARYAFRRHFYQHAGFRYIETDIPVKICEDVYETDALVSQYCEAHYGLKYFDVENFSEKSAAFCFRFMEGRPMSRALDLGCSVGRTTFELAKKFDIVTGLDFSARFIRIADDMANKGFIRYILPEEGDLVSYHEKKSSDFGLAGLENKVEFYQADAQNLKPIFKNYDLIFAGNLIDRLNDPAKFLASIHERLNSGGLLIIASPYTWLAQFTSRENWIGGFKQDGEPVTTFDGLHKYLDKNFTLIGGPEEIPFVIRETRRKFQHIISEFTVWEKKKVGDF